MQRKKVPQYKKILHVFTKGGDSTDYMNIPEWQVCQELGIAIIPQVGLKKEWSSSEY